MSGSRSLTGRKVLGISVAAFGVILAANLTLAWYAVGTFSGLVVDNGYVSSQSFDAERRAQQALGWSLDLAYDGAAVRLDFTDAAGRTARPATLAVVVGRPTSSRTDRSLELQRTPTGYAALAALDPGAWLVQVDAVAMDGTNWRRRQTLTVEAGR